MEGETNVKMFNPAKEIAHETTLEAVIWHRDAFKQLRTGAIVGVPIEKLTDDELTQNKARALSLIVSAQREMITISRPVIKAREYNRWQKRERAKKQSRIASRQQGKEITDKQKKTPFEEEKNDYNKLLEILDFLVLCEQQIIRADKTKSAADDFVIKISRADGEKLELTENFFDMRDALEDSFEEINELMIRHKIVSGGLEEDEEFTYRENEQEAIRRIVEA